MNYQYSQEAKERISKLGQSAVIDFIGEVSPVSRRKVYSLMPKVQGFRVGHPAELKEKQKRFIGYLFQTHSSPEEIYAWKCFSLFWEFWAEEHIGKTFLTRDDPKPVTNLGGIFIKELADVFPDVAREDIERLFIFSGFADDPEVTAAFGLFRPATVLARDNVVDGLPIRLDELEKRIEYAEMIVEDSDNSIKRLESTTDSLSVELKKSIRDINHNLKIITELKNLLNTQTKRSDAIIKVIDEFHVFKNDINRAIEVIELKVDAYTLALDEFSSREKVLDSIAKEISDLRTSFTIICEKENEWTDSDGENNYKKLYERIDVLEKKAAKNDSDLIISQCVKFYENKLLEPYKNISSYDSAFNMIASNLQAVGLIKGSSFTVARLTLAAFISGQIVQFCGSLADIVADAIATAVGAPTYHEWRVPVGLISDAAAFDFIESIADSSHCLILKGANLSAFEIYGTAIRDIVVQRQLYSTNYDHLALIAAWKHGPAVFPDGGMLAELGPVIDTDTLRMKGISASLPELNSGGLAKDQWAKIEGLKSDSASASIDELRELLDETGFDGGNLWRRMINRYYTSLMRMPGGNDIDDLHLVLSSYTLPWARIKGGPIKEIADIVARELKEHSEKILA
ncbi:hypothetical protein [Pectobacterium versatile]|uniref:hypothetical protein n=1 Tax=Pectobacterium versatile TaxID=2488639 RepID=UPI000F8C8F83|nr:hypothetical protein [Pectobacterium versatile]RUR92765.1 hypothetical protein PB16LOC_01692 [Pectobacterium versatile]